MKPQNRDRGREPRGWTEISTGKQFAEKVDRVLQRSEWTHKPWGLARQDFYLIVDYAQLGWTGVSSDAKESLHACGWRQGFCNLGDIAMAQHADSVSGRLGYTGARFWEGGPEADDSHCLALKRCTYQLLI